jgi:4,5-dihydroxyphthalate decarboxylase
VSEMSLAEMVYYFSRGECDFIAIPVFPSRLFRHAYIFCNRSAGIRAPEDLNGKKIGALRWVQTAFIWVRGMLVDDYGLSPKDTHWYVSALHHWQEGGSKEKIETRDGSVIQRLSGDGADEYDMSCRALIEGRIDVLMTTENRRYDRLAAEPEVRPLFADARAAEIAYFRQSAIMPIMHVLVARRSMVDAHPDLPEKLFRLFCQSKKAGRNWTRSIPSLTLAWKDRYLEEEQKIFQSDPWRYGLHVNLAALTKFLSYCYGEGVSARRITPQDLFAPATWDLSDD